MTTQRSGALVSSGGLAWIAGVLVLELTVEPDSDSLPLIFSLLATLAGAAVGWGCWGAAGDLDRRLGRLGMRATAVCSGALGVGFGFDLIPGFWVGFFLAYTFGLFLLPFALLVLGLGVFRSSVFPAWAKAVPFALVAVSVTTYGFHAVARDVWDPPDAVWFTLLGVGWVLLGTAIARFSAPGAAAGTPAPVPGGGASQG